MKSILRAFPFLAVLCCLLFPAPSALHAVDAGLDGLEIPSAEDPMLDPLMPFLDGGVGPIGSLPLVVGFHLMEEDSLEGEALP